MSKVLAWTVSLKDGMSRIARGVTSALGGMERALNSASAASDKLDAKISKTGRDSLGRFVKAGDQVEKTFRDVNGRLRFANGRFADTGKALSATGKAADAAKKSWEGFRNSFLGNLAADAARAAATAVFDLSVQFGRAILEQKKFEQSTRFAFDQLLGGADKGGAAFEAALATAEELGRSSKEILSSFNSLMAVGFDAKETDKIVRSMADLAALNPAANIEKITLALGQIKGKGVVQMEELQGQLAETGLRVADVLTKIAELRGKGENALDIRKLITAGGVSSDLGIDAIMATINDSAGGGEAGSLAAEKSTSTLEGSLGRLKNLSEQFIRTLDVDPDQLSGAIAKIGKFIDPSTESGEKLQRVVEKIFALLGKIGGAALDELLENLPEHLDRIEKLLDSMDPEGVERLGIALAMVVEGSLFAAEALLALVSVASSLISDFGELATAIGQGIIDGIVSAILGGASLVAGSMTSVVQGGIDAAEETLGIASPSKVMADIADNATGTYADHMEKGGPAAAAAFSNLVDPTVAGGSSSSVSAPIQVGGAAASTISNVSNTRTASKQYTVTVNATGIEPARLAQMIRSEVSRVMEAA